MGVVLHQAWSESQCTVLMGCLSISTNVRHCLTHNRWLFFFFQKDSSLVHMHCAYNAVQLLRRSQIPFFRSMPPNNSKLNTLNTRFRDSYSSMSMSHESKRLKKPSSDWLKFWQCTNTAFEWKMRFSCFPILPGTAEAQVIWGGTVKSLLNAYLLVTFLPKNIKVRSRVSKL